MGFDISTVCTCVAVAFLLHVKVYTHNYLLILQIDKWKETIVRLQEALNEVQLLSGLLPICACCKKIKDEHKVWQPFESYTSAHSEAKFSHGLCPDCMRKPDSLAHFRTGCRPHARCMASSP